jgi:hypothetical protein
MAAGNGRQLKPLATAVSDGRQVIFVKPIEWRGHSRMDLLTLTSRSVTTAITEGVFVRATYSSEHEQTTWETPRTRVDIHLAIHTAGGSSTPRRSDGCVSYTRQALTRLRAWLRCSGWLVPPSASMSEVRSGRMQEAPSREPSPIGHLTTAAVGTGRPGDSSRRPKP